MGPVPLWPISLEIKRTKCPIKKIICLVLFMQDFANISNLRSPRKTAGLLQMNFVKEDCSHPSNSFGIFDRIWTRRQKVFLLPLSECKTPIKIMATIKHNLLKVDKIISLFACNPCTMKHHEKGL
jgi:hypothetical protein